MAFKTKYPEIVAVAKEKYKDLEVVLNIFSILWMCEKSAKKMGYSQKEMEDLKLKDLITNLDPKGIALLVIGYFFGEGNRYAVIKRKDGKKLYVTGDAAPFYYKGEVYVAGTNMQFKPYEEKK